VAVPRHPGGPVAIRNAISYHIILQQAVPGLTRLSSLRIRDILYFGTALGNHSLVVGVTEDDSRAVRDDTCLTN
jgi:hypothetical protein